MYGLRSEGFKLHGGPVHFACYSRDGAIKWEVIEPHNMVVNDGLAKLLDVMFIGSTQIATWYCGLIGTGGTVASGDTVATHGGWTELTNYATAARATFVFARTDLVASNSASTISYAINTAGSVMGAFIVSDATKGGSLGTLFSGVAFTAGDKSTSDGDTLTITYALSAADA